MITTTGLEKAILLKNCFRSNIFNISADNSTSSLLSEYQTYIFIKNWGILTLPLNYAFYVFNE